MCKIYFVAFEKKNRSKLIMTIETSRLTHVKPLHYAIIKLDKVTGNDRMSLVSQLLLFVKNMYAN